MSRETVERQVAKIAEFASNLLATPECSDEKLPFAFPVRHWTRQNDFLYTGRWQLSRRPEACLERKLEAFVQSPAYQQCVDEAHHDGRLSSFEGKLVGTPRGSATFRAEDFAIRVGVEACRALRRGTAVPEFAEHVVNSLWADKVEYELLAPLPRFQSNALPIHLADHVEMRELTDSEFEICVNERLVEVQSQTPPTLEFRSDGSRQVNESGMLEWIRVPGRVGLSTHFSLPLSVGPISSKQETQSRAAASDAEVKLGAVISALRVFKDGYVWFPGYLTRTRNWWLQGGQSFFRSDRAPRGDYVLLDQEAENFAAFWAQLRDAHAIAAPWFGAAIRRFGFAADRSRDEDKLVDVMIAFESVFLHDSQDELAYKLATRAASYLGHDEADRKRIYDGLRASYAARSHVVHGSRLKLRHFSSLAAMLEFLEETFRQATTRIAEELASGAKNVDYWDNYVMADH
jgi:hypothetical protein